MNCLTTRYTISHGLTTFSQRFESVPLNKIDYLFETKRRRSYTIYNKILLLLLSLL